MSLIQIYEITNVNEAIRIAGIGADHIGVTVGDGSYQNEVRPFRAKEIFLSLPKEKKGIARTFSPDPHIIGNIIRQSEPDILHIAANIEDLMPNQIDNLKKEFPSTEFMRTIPVVGEESVVAAMMYDSLYDYILLDTKDDKLGQIGSTGKTHDWSISTKIVESITTKVILAGGLGADNVEEAIKKVKPYGVMSKTKTDKIGGREKDLIKVKMFVDKVKSATIGAA